MPVITDPAALEALQSKDCLLPDNTVNRNAVTTLVVAEMEANHVAHSEADIDNAAVAPETLAATIFDVSSPELSKLVAGLLGLGEKSKVHVSLSDGLYVCGRASKVQLEVLPGKFRSFSIATRFLSGDGTLVRKYRIAGFQKRGNSAARAQFRVLADVKTRSPELADQVDQWIEELQLSFQLALTTGDGS